jgi:hypothetical protein
MFKWLRGRNASRRVGVIESVQVDEKRSVILVRRDNIEHLVMIGGRNDVMIESNIVRQPAANAACRPVPETKALASPNVSTRESIAKPAPESFHNDLGELIRGLEFGASRHPFEPRSSVQSKLSFTNNVQVEPDSKPTFHAPPVSANR